MHIEDRQEDRDPPASSAHDQELLSLINDIHRSVAWRDDQAIASGHLGVGIAEEISRKEGETDQQTRQSNDPGHQDSGKEEVTDNE